MVLLTKNNNFATTACKNWPTYFYIYFHSYTELDRQNENLRKEPSSLERRVKGGWPLGCSKKVFTLFNNDGGDNGEKSSQRQYPPAPRPALRRRSRPLAWPATWQPSRRQGGGSEEVTRGGRPSQAGLAAATTTVGWRHRGGFGRGTGSHLGRPNGYMGEHTLRAADASWRQDLPGCPSGSDDDVHEASLTFHHKVSLATSSIYSYNIHKCMCSIYI